MCVSILIEMRCSPQSPADLTRKIHAGDEVIQVNQQTVVSGPSDLTFIYLFETEQYACVNVVLQMKFCAM